jgi:hypothetical protein
VDGSEDDVLVVTNESSNTPVVPQSHFWGGNCEDLSAKKSVLLARLHSISDEHPGIDLRSPIFGSNCQAEELILDAEERALRAGSEDDVLVVTNESSNTPVVQQSHFGGGNCEEQNFETDLSAKKSALLARLHSIPDEHPGIYSRSPIFGSNCQAEELILDAEERALRAGLGNVSEEPDDESLERAMKILRKIPVSRPSIRANRRGAGTTPVVHAGNRTGSQENAKLPVLHPETERVLKQFGLHPNPKEEPLPWDPDLFFPEAITMDGQGDLALLALNHGHNHRLAAFLSSYSTPNCPLPAHSQPTPSTLPPPPPLAALPLSLPLRHSLPPSIRVPPPHSLLLSSVSPSRDRLSIPPSPIPPW